MCHQNLTMALFDFVPKQLRQPVMLGSLRIDVCIFLIFGLAHTGFFYLSENFDFVYHFIEGLSIVLLQHYLYSHRWLSSVEDHGLC